MRFLGATKLETRNNSEQLVYVPNEDKFLIGRCLGSFREKLLPWRVSTVWSNVAFWWDEARSGTAESSLSP